jgi:hypothetical protein
MVTMSSCNLLCRQLQPRFLTEMTCKNKGEARFQLASQTMVRCQCTVYWCIEGMLQPVNAMMSGHVRICVYTCVVVNCCCMVRQDLQASTAQQQPTYADNASKQKACAAQPTYADNASKQKACAAQATNSFSLCDLTNNTARPQSGLLWVLTARLS